MLTPAGECDIIISYISPKE